MALITKATNMVTLRCKWFNEYYGDEHLSILYSVQTGSDAHPTSYQMATGGSSAVVKRAGREADHTYI
jgi:hypothetical protein